MTNQRAKQSSSDNNLSLPCVSHVYTHHSPKHSVLSTEGHAGRKKRKERKNQIRNKMIDDLVVFINKLQAKNYNVILPIDMNESFEYGKGEVAKLI